MTRLHNQNRELKLGQSLPHENINKLYDINSLTVFIDRRPEIYLITESQES